MRISPGPKPVRKPQELDFVDGTQNLGYRTLDDLVLQRRYTQWSLAAIRLGDIDSARLDRMLYGILSMLA